MKNSAEQKKFSTFKQLNARGSTGKYFSCRVIMLLCQLTRSSLLGMFRKVLIKAWLWGGLFLSLGSPPQAAAQCVMCRTQIESNLKAEESRHAGEGINRGVLYLMAVPYVAVTVIAYMWYRRARRATRKPPRNQQALPL